MYQTALQSMQYLSRHFNQDHIYMNLNEVRASLKSLGYHFVSKSVHLGDVDIFPRIIEYVELLMTLKGKVKDHQCLYQIVSQSMQ